MDYKRVIGHLTKYLIKTGFAPNSIENREKVKEIMQPYEKDLATLKSILESYEITMEDFLKYKLNKWYKEQHDWEVWKESITGRVNNDDVKKIESIFQKLSATVYDLIEGKTYNSLSEEERLKIAQIIFKKLYDVAGKQKEVKPQSYEYPAYSLAASLDSRLLGIHTKIAEVWQNKTYKSKDALRQILHEASACFYIANTYGGNFDSENVTLEIAGNFFSIAFAVSQVLEAYMLPLKNKSYGEEFLDPLEFWNTRFNRLSLQFIGYYSTSIGILGATHALLNNDQIAFTSVLPMLALGFGSSSASSAYYLGKVDIGKPPDKPEKQSIKERLEEKIKAALENAKRLVPKPLPQPESA